MFFFLFFLTVLIFLNNYRYHDNTRGWQGRYGRQYQHHATLQPRAHHHLWRVGPRFHRQHINVVSTQLGSYDRSFQPGLETGRWSSSTPRYNHGHTTIFDALAPMSIASTSTYQHVFTTHFQHYDNWGSTEGGGLETQIRLEPSVCSIFLFFLTVLIFLNNYRYHDNTRGWQGRYGHQYQHHGHTTIFDVSAPTSIAIRQHINVSTRLNSYDRSFQRGLETGCWSSLVDYIYVWHGFRLHLTFRWYPREIDGLDDKSKLFFFRLVLFSLYD